MPVSSCSLDSAFPLALSNQYNGCACVVYFMGFISHTPCHYFAYKQTPDSPFLFCRNTLEKDLYYACQISNALDKTRSCRPFGEGGKKHKHLELLQTGSRSFRISRGQRQSLKRQSYRKPQMNSAAQQSCSVV